MRQFSYPNSQFTNILGGASIGWKLNVYDTGTTDYASIYSNLAQTTPTANPVIADADGFLASFYWTGTVDVVLTDENDNLIDSAAGIQDIVSTINAVVVAGNITLPFGDASGSGDTITATLPITSDFSDGGVFIVRANANNAGTINTPNLQINSYASRRIKKIGGSALVANDIVSGMNCLLVYHEAQDSYYLLNPNASYLNRDGTAKMLGVIDMDSHKITNLANGTANGDAVNYLQLGGDAAREFAVANATVGNSAVNLTTLINIVYPVGSVYISKTDNRNPNTILGAGTWIAVDGKALFGYKSGDADFGTVGSGGGSKDLSLTMTVDNRISTTGSPPPSTITVTTNGVYSDYINTGDGVVATDIDCRFKLSQEKILPPYDTFYIWERTA